MKFTLRLKSQAQTVEPLKPQRDKIINSLTFFRLLITLHKSEEYDDIVCVLYCLPRRCYGKLPFGTDRTSVPPLIPSQAKIILANRSLRKIGDPICCGAAQSPSLCKENQCLRLSPFFFDGTILLKLRSQHRADDLALIAWTDDCPTYRSGKDWPSS
ncbi:hypothetical protein RRG08_000970 [Elysia crispata]|uniref:Uncharacterized protein n=1 Tax=Elysia crispata TaxID=231223 RepID=A0AAE1DYA1_9GAST|nr:hypothetical protein RRG08_000970 [Elysia crispata]